MQGRQSKVRKILSAANLRRKATYSLWEEEEKKEKWDGERPEGEEGGGGRRKRDRWRTIQNENNTKHYEQVPSCI